MGDSAANNAKARWNTANYTQIKAYVNPDIASSFKAACAAANVSMNSALTRFMVDFSGARARDKPVKEVDFVSTNKKRREKHGQLLRDLILLRDAQDRANENVHENFRGLESFETAEDRVTKMSEAIEILEGVY